MLSIADTYQSDVFDQSKSEGDGAYFSIDLLNILKDWNSAIEDAKANKQPDVLKGLSRYLQSKINNSKKELDLNLVNKKDFENAQHYATELFLYTDLSKKIDTALGQLEN